MFLFNIHLFLHSIIQLFIHSNENQGRCDVVDTWWQTETGGIMISPRPSAPGEPIEPAMPMRPFFGIDLTLLADGKDEIPADKKPAEGTRL